MSAHDEALAALKAAEAALAAAEAAEAAVAAEPVKPAEVVTKYVDQGPQYLGPCAVNGA